MLSLRYTSVQSASNCHFFLESDFESTSWNNNNLLVTAYQKDNQLNNFVCISPDTVKSNKFIVGNISAKRTQDGLLRASVDFDAHDKEDLKARQDQLFTSHPVTITLLRGSLKSMSLLQAVAHFDVTIEQDSRLPLEDIRRYFDVRLFKQVDKLPLVELPAKQRSKKYHVIELDGYPDNHTKKRAAHKNRFDIQGFMFDDYAIVLPSK